MTIIAEVAEFEFQKAIEEKRFIDAKNILEDPVYKNVIHYRTTYSIQSTFMHYVICCLLKEIERIWTTGFLDSFYSCGEDLYKKHQQAIREQVINRLSNDALTLIQKMIECEFKYNELSFEKRAIDLLNEKVRDLKEKIPYHLIAPIQAKITKTLEIDAQKLFPGRRYVTDLWLYRYSKKPEKICYIPDQPTERDDDITELTLHQRQALHAAWLKKIALGEGLNKESPNLVIAHMGFIISDKPKQEDRSHKPTFITFPIIFEGFSIRGQFSIPQAELTNPIRTHAEFSLCTYLNEDDNLNQIIDRLMLFKSINPEDNRYKIYGIVLDLHSSLVVCSGCNWELLKLNNEESDFRRKLEGILGNRGFIISDKVTPTPLRIIVRASGSNSWNIDMPKNPNDIYPSAIIHQHYNRDIKSHDPGVLLHLLPTTIPHYEINNWPVDEVKDLTNELKEIRKIYTTKAEKKLAKLKERGQIYRYRFFNHVTAFSNTGKDYGRENCNVLRPNEQVVDKATREALFEHSLNILYCNGAVVPSSLGLAP